MSGPTIRARERFAATGAADASVEGAILASWIRSRLCGAGPDRREARYDGASVPGSPEALAGRAGELATAARGRCVPLHELAVAV